jgi:hypothetical protein
VVVITEELWKSIIDDFEEQRDKADIIESLMNGGYSVLEADAIYAKAKFAYEKDHKPKEVNTKLSWREWLHQPPQKIFQYALLTGILLPLLYFVVLQPPFSFMYGFTWMVYVLGTWMFCLGTGNMPAFFAKQGDIMIAQCKHIGTPSPLALSIIMLGGILLTLIIGTLLIIYMSSLARKFHFDEETDPGIKKHKFFAAWFNGTIGFSCLTAISFLLGSGLSGQIALDVYGIGPSLHISGAVVYIFLQSLTVLAWILALYHSTRILFKKKHD